MTKNQAQEIVDYIERSLQNTESEALQSVGSDGKYPYMVGAFKQTLIFISERIRTFSKTEKEIKR